MTLRLFVADDSVTIQRIINLALSNEDVLIESVSRGDSALESVRAFKPDLVFADVFMPGCSGYEVCASIREDPDLADTPVVLLVGTFEPYDEAEASRVKCNGHLTKPFDTEELLQTVRSFAGDKMFQRSSEVSAEHSIESEHPAAPAAPKLNSPDMKGFLSPRVRESFLGSERILELFEPGTAVGTDSSPSTQPRGAADREAKSFMQNGQSSEDFINLIVDRVVRRMSADVIREVAWEVVPELSEALIRQTIEERNKS